MNYVYKTKASCSTSIAFVMDDSGMIEGIHFTGGCQGNLSMLSKLLSGKSASYIIEACSGNLCGSKKTSCADQLAIAVQKAVDGELF